MGRRAGGRGAVTPKHADYTRERIAYWEAYGQRPSRFDLLRRGYRRRLAEIYQFLIPPGMRVLELGSGSGDLLAAVEPAYGVGIDFSPGMVARSQARHPQLNFHQADAHSLGFGERFDYIIVSDLVNDVWNVQQVFERALAHSHTGTRILINSYSRLWEAPRRIAEMLGFARRQLPQNWLTVEDLTNLLYLAGFERIRTSQEIMLPLRVPLLDAFANRFLVKLWPTRHLGLTNLLVARPRPLRRS